MTEQQFKELKPGDIFEDTLTNGLTFEVTEQVRKWPDSLYVRDMQQDKIVILKIADCANYSFIDTSKLPQKYFYVFFNDGFEMERANDITLVIAPTEYEAKEKYINYHGGLDLSSFQKGGDYHIFEIVPVV